MSRATLLLLGIVVLATGVLSPKSAEGSCGDWLAHSSSDTAMSDAPDATSPDAPYRPCNGPLCQKGPMHAPPAAPEKVNRPENEPVLAVLASPDCQERLVTGLGDDFLGERAGFAFGIDRPPQS